MSAVAAAARPRAVARPAAGSRVRVAAATAAYAFVAATVVFLALPIVSLVIMSFSAAEYIHFPPIGFSLKWYGRILQMPGFADSLVLSLRLAALATALSVGIGVAAALGLARTHFRGRNAVIAGLMSPLVVPSIVTGLALLQFFVDRDLRSANWNLLAGHVIITLPYVTRTVLASLEVFDWSLVDTARVLGAGPLRAFWRVTLPIVRPGILAGAIFAFLTSFDNYTVSFFLADATLVPLPVTVFNYINNVFDPGVAALSAVLIYASAIVLIVTERLVGASRLRGF
jgi:putative spermidine/putrescine transport system permease protein